MAFPSCSLWIFVARTDVSFMMHTIPHLIRMSTFPFEERVLAVDTAPLTGDKVSRPGIGTLDELRTLTQKLLERKIIDRVVDINYEPSYRQRIYTKHFGSPLSATHNYKGYPILGSIFTIEECRSDYMVHFDSDMMMYQQPDFSWIKEGIELMDKYPELMFVRPLSGPPTPDGSMFQSSLEYLHPDGFYQFKSFGSRVYLLNRKRFDKLLPLPTIWHSYKPSKFDLLSEGLKTFLNIFTGQGKLNSWEIMVSQKLQQTNYFRSTLTNPKAWTLHPIDRSPAFIEALPGIIEKIEAGEFPSEQAGYYDLIPKLWY